MEYLVSQMFVESYTLRETKMFCAIRLVIANTRSEAIGKFYLDTDSLKFERRVEPIDCILLKDLKKV